jgi:histidinol-phosphate aminotransferase
VADIKKALTARTKVIFVASPNNPTGNTASEKELVGLVATGKIVVVDEAYLEFSSDATVANLVPSYPNLIVLRTFSKWAGLAGLRIGYGFFPVDIADYVMKIKQPYNANAAAQTAVLASLADTDYLRANVTKIVMERERLFGELKALDWLKPYPSRANFMLCRLPEGEARETWQQLRKKGIFVRYFDTPLLEDCLRISVGRPVDTDALVEALKEVKHG